MSRLGPAAALACLIAGGPTGVAHAADKNAAAAKEHVEKATAHFDLNEWQPALDEFKEAYRFKADPALLFNIARCHHKLGQREDAVAFYNKYLTKAKLAAKGGTVAREEQVRKWIAELEGPPDAPAAAAGPGAAAGKTGGGPFSAKLGAGAGKATTVETPPPSAAPAAKRRFTVVAQGKAEDRTLIRQSREAVEQGLTAMGHELVPWKTFSDADAQAISSAPKPGDGAWGKALDRLKLDEVVLCQVENAGLLASFAKPQYSVEVAAYDRAGTRTNKFTVELQRANLDDKTKDRLIKELK